jgi:hypothetical protein
MIALALIENLFKTNFQWDDDDDHDKQDGMYYRQETHLHLLY